MNPIPLTNRAYRIHYKKHPTNRKLHTVEDLILLLCKSRMADTPNIIPSFRKKQGKTFPQSLQRRSYVKHASLLTRKAHLFAIRKNRPNMSQPFIYARKNLSFISKLSLPTTKLENCHDKRLTQKLVILTVHHNQQTITFCPPSSVEHK